MPNRPKMAEGLEVHETEEGLIVYQDSADRVHHLNHTAAVILELCDGIRAVEEIAEVVGQIFGLPNPPSTETRECIADLERESLVS